MPTFFIVPLYIKKAESFSLETAGVESSMHTIKELCDDARISCKATGEWVHRKVFIHHGDTARIAVDIDGSVAIETTKRTRSSIAREALLLLAYGVFDLVARESVKGLPWSRATPPAGRPKTGVALNNAERQARFRSKRHQTECRSKHHLGRFPG